MRFSIVLVVAAISLLGFEAYWRLIHKAEWSHFKGQWAVVTGSSYGIGRDFALELAARGLSVVLHGRSESRLKPVAKEIEQRFSGVRVRVITQDVVSDNGWDEAEKLLRELGNVAVLINNVGGGSLDAQVARLHERSKNYTDDVARMNFHSTVHWTRIFLANFVRHNQQAKNDASKMKEGRIITCSSLSHVWGYGESVYPASKSGLHAFTRIINNEYYNADNIRAEALIIGLVSTPALDSIPPDAFGFVASSDTLAKNALNMFGWREVYAPIFLHQILELAGYVAPLSARSHAAKSGLENVKQFVQGGREKINKNKEL